VSEREPLLNAREIAEWFGLSPDTVIDRFESGDIPGFKLYGKRGGPVRFRPSEVAAALESWRPRKAATPGRGECQQTPTDAAAGPLSTILRLANKPRPLVGGRRDEEES
jgi:hypothetical protein